MSEPAQIAVVCTDPRHRRMNAEIGTFHRGGPWGEAWVFAPSFKAVRQGARSRRSAPSRGAIGPIEFELRCPLCGRSPRLRGEQRDHSLQVLLDGLLAAGETTVELRLFDQAVEGKRRRA